jgi:hypothetical protein
MKGLFIENIEGFDVTCEIVFYEITRVPEGDDAVTELTRNSSFEENMRIKNLFDQAQIGDKYYVDNIKMKCPRDDESRNTYKRLMRKSKYLK